MVVTVQRRAPTLVLLVAVVISASAQTTPRRQPPMRPVDGATIFRNNCAACHGLEGRKDGPVSKALHRKAPDLTGLSQRNSGAFPTVHVRTTIMFGADDLLPAHGTKTMPIWGPIFHEIEFDQDFGNVRLENLTKYLESIQRNREPTAMGRMARSAGSHTSSTLTDGTHPITATVQRQQQPR